MSKENFDIYAEVTNKIIAQLEQGVIPWHRPWSLTASAISHVTGKPYSMLNQFLLGKPGEYVTFKQCKEKGGTIKKGTKAKMVVFWKWLEKPALDKSGAQIIGKDGKPEIEKIPYLRYYNVFHIEDCEGIQPKYTERTGAAEVHADAEEMLIGYVNRSGVTLEHREQDQAFYRPSEDKIVLPLMKQFKTTAGYYGTAFHEAVHSTGHSSRLNRLSGTAHFGNESYSKEELVAEIGSAMLMAKAGLEGEFDNSVAYIGGWLKALKDDKRMIVSAAGKAEKAAAYIIGDIGAES